MKYEERVTLDEEMIDFIRFYDRDVQMVGEACVFRVLTSLLERMKQKRIDPKSMKVLKNEVKITLDYCKRQLGRK